MFNNSVQRGKGKGFYIKIKTRKNSDKRRMNFKNKQTLIYIHIFMN